MVEKQYDYLKILVLNNNFYGSYESNQVFLNELIQVILASGAQVYSATTTNEAINYYETIDLDFSICFSKYYYFEENIPLYEIYKKKHYQWVSDNPMKMDLDQQSSWITYIFIDDEFVKVLAGLKNKQITLPLGFLESNRMSYKNDKIEAVLVPCKIRNLNEIESQINDHPSRKYLQLFLNSYDYNSSFIQYYVDFNNIYKHTNEEFFRLVNEYTRVKKRVAVVNSIKVKDVYIVGKDYGNFTNQPNVKFINPVKYSEIAVLMNRFSYVINVDPNYHSCIHDRYMKAVNSGTVCLTNESCMFSKMHCFVYSMNNLPIINLLFDEIDKNYEKIMNCEFMIIDDFSWSKSFNIIVSNYLINKAG